MNIEPTPMTRFPLLSVCDERLKMMVLLMSSTGMRVGALPNIKLKHLQRQEIDKQGTHVYQITVHVNSKKDRYTTFCTPECAQAIDTHLNLRKQYDENLKQHPDSGNWLTSETNLIIRSFNREDTLFAPEASVGSSTSLSKKLKASPYYCYEDSS